MTKEKKDDFPKSKNINTQDDLIKKLGNLSSEKLSLITSRLKNKSSSQNLESTIKPRQKKGLVPISLTQEWWWLLEQVQPNSAAFNQSCSVRFTGKLSVSTLEKSINEIVSRHENLRTSFSVIDGNAYQNVAESLYIKLLVIDVIKEPGKEIDITIKDLIAKEASKTFNLSQLPLLRTCLLRISDEDYILVITNHHLILDGWSARVLAKEISALYQAFYIGKPSPLPNLPIQYADFSLWQREYLQTEVLGKKTSYWKEKLANASTSLDLPTDHPYPLKQSFAGRRNFFIISTSIRDKLKSIGQLQEATPFMVFLAAFKLLLYRYSHQKDLIVGTPVANRTLEEVKPLIGLFANNLPLHSNLVGNPTFSEFLAQISKVCLEAYKHEDFPFNKLLSQLQNYRLSGRSALFQAVFLYQSLLIGKLNKSSDFSISMFVSPKEDATMAIVDISLEVSEAGLGNFIYRRDLFEEATIERMKNHFLNLLSAIANNPDQPILEMPLMTDAERYTIVTKWNKTDFPYPNLCVHEIFQKQVLETPNNVAVVYGGEKLSYQELEEKSNQLANYLQTLGVKEENLVGVYLERSINLIIALLAIFKAGAVYLPLDPSYPPERLSYIISDSKAPIVITSENLVVNLAIAKTTIVSLEKEASLIEKESLKSPVSKICSDNLAYAIYTSGSTGLPKGTLLAHRGLSSLITTQIAHFQIKPTSRLLQTLSITGDASLWEIFAALLSGGSLYLASKDQTLPGEEFVDLLNENKITILCPAIRALSAVPEREIPTLETILAGGETCPPELINKWAKNHNLYNCYGPTEATVTTTYFKCEVGMNKTPPIGKPFANSKVYILDKYLQPVPIGVVGEIYISGVSLARGYLERPALTAEKFLPDPFSQTPSQRMYKTGDLAKYLADGNIQFLGRADHQIKIRGFRIELDEIEEIIFSHPGVAEAVVIVEEITPGDKEILAYLVAKEKKADLLEDLRSLLKAKLPAFMLPAEIIVMDVFPRLLSGKVDRRSLPIPKSFSHEVSSLPLTNTEKSIANIWKNLLKKDAIDRNDDFFDLGGHSMLMVELANQLKNTFKVNVPLRVLFEFPKLIELSQAIDKLLENAPLESDFDLEKELYLEPKILPQTTFIPPLEINKVFLTGATGFLGGFLLANLLSDTKADIYSLVRAKDIQEAKTKIKQNLIKYKLWQEAFEPRIFPVLGDLSKPFFSLDENAFDKLAQEIDVIYHCGAEVNFSTPYSRLKNTNVNSTVEALRFAVTNKLKALHLISSIAALITKTPPKLDKILEDASLPEDFLTLSTGYAQSKWVSEKLAAVGRQRGIPIAIYRPGWICGDSKTGISSNDDFLSNFIECCVKLGFAPDWKFPLDVSPVDYVSKAIVCLSKQEDSLGKAFHLTNPSDSPATFSEVVEWLNQLGHLVKPLSVDNWLVRVLEAKEDSKNAFLSFMPALFALLGKEPVDMESLNSINKFSSNKEGFGNIIETAQVIDSTKIKKEKELQKNWWFDCRNTLHGISRSKVFCPLVDINLFSSLFPSLAFRNKQ